LLSQKQKIGAQAATKQILALTRFYDWFFELNFES